MDYLRENRKPNLRFSTSENGQGDRLREDTAGTQSTWRSKEYEMLLHRNPEDFSSREFITF